MPLVKKMLNANKRPSNSAKYDNRDQRPSELEDNGLVYLGDRYVNVLIQENGHIYDVAVTKD